jgi:mannose-6-phosphate isomerase-like protein (cupin superfamily)/DNA-binding XRE family transcriptional regulator
MKNENGYTMTDQIKLIAERIKGLRDILGISSESLAGDLGISNELLNQYESGNIDIPVGILFKLGQKYNIELSALLSGENPRLHVYCVVRKGKGLNIDRRKQYKYEHLAYNFINKKAEPFIVTIDPPGEGVQPEFNSHPGQEFNYVIEGTMKIMIDDHEVILNQGDSIYYDSSHNHAMRALNNAPVKMLAIIL